MARERVLTPRELNRALLARQLLLRRARLAVRAAVERIGGVQAQWPPSPYVALWTRLDGFHAPKLLRALERRQVVKATLMRTTLHLVSAHDYLAYAGELFRRRIAALEQQLARQPGETNVEELVRQILQHTSERPRSRPELLGLLGQPKLAVDERRPWLVWHLLSVKAGLVHTPSSAAWRNTTVGARFAPARAWLGSEGGEGVEATAHLLRRYLAAFGPATRADAAQWTGLAVGALQTALETMPLRRFRDERDRVLLDLQRAPLPPAATSAPPRFLPRWDSSLLAHGDRSRILPEAYRKEVIRRNGDVQAVFLVDGVVAGTWGEDGGRVELEPFEPLPRSAHGPLEDERRALQAFLARRGSE